MNEQIVQANRKYRRIVLMTCAVFVGIGFALVRWGLPWATCRLAQLEPEESLLILRVTLGLMFLSVLPMAWYIWSLGRKIVGARRLPPPGVKVIKDIKIIEGAAAITRGKALMVMAMLMALLSLIGGLWLPWKLGQIMPRHAPGNTEHRLDQSTTDEVSRPNAP
jgi:hypothetical protein